eukprot:scaffold1524_cov182-Ochromonas_danica.AAC.8
MSSRSLLLQLPRDILHSVYSEWLSSWRDLSCLDVGCLAEGDREAWLRSLREVKVSLPLRRLSDVLLVSWYDWVISRQVFLVESFPVLLGVLGNLVSMSDGCASYCAALHSIEMESAGDCLLFDGPALTSVFFTDMQERVDFFMRACSGLKGITYSSGCDEMNGVVFSSLIREREANTLSSIAIHFSSPLSPSTLNKIGQLLMKHLSQMETLEFSSDAISEESVNGILSLLHEKTTPLKRLSLPVGYLSLTALLTSLSSSLGRYLESLTLGRCMMIKRVNYMEGDFLFDLGRSCPRLKRLTLSTSISYDDFAMRKFCQMFVLCPNLISFTYSSLFRSIVIDVIGVNDQYELIYSLGSIKLLSREDKEEALDCISAAIQRSQHKMLALSNQPFCDDLVKQYDDWVLFKSKLSSYLTDLHGVMSESVLIEAVQGLPRLEKLDCIVMEGERLSDLSLAVLIEKVCGLKKICIYSLRYRPEAWSFSDEMVSKVVRGCDRLEELTIPCAGCETVLAVRHHVRLRKVSLEYVTEAKEVLAGIVLEDEREAEECAWRRLQEGSIIGIGYNFTFLPDCGIWM